MQHSYRQLAALLAEDMQANRYRPGDALPSVRVLAQQQGVSLSTAVRCYRHLEQQGLAIARPRSGHYVANTAVAPPPTSVQQPATPTQPHRMEWDSLVSVQHRVAQLHALTAQPLQWPLHLASATPGWYPCEELARTGQRLLRQSPSLLGQYPAGMGLPALQKQLALHMARCGVDVPAHEVMVTHGSTEALHLALRCVCQPGDSVAVESPVYFGLLQMLDSLGLKALEVPCSATQGLSLEALAYALEHQPGVRALVAMPSFQNPLGTCMADAAKRQLLGLLERHGVTLIEDDAFGDLSASAERPRPVKAWDTGGHVIYCGSLSKSLAPGLRVGWVMAGRHGQRLRSLKLGQSLSTPWLEQAMLAQYLQSGAWPSHLRRLRERLATTLPQAVAAIRQHFPLSTQVQHPAAGWWLWISLPEGTDALALLPASVRDGLAFTPGALFSHTGKFDHCLRINIAQPWKAELQDALARLGQHARMLARAAPDPTH